MKQKASNFRIFNFSLKLKKQTQSIPKIANLFVSQYINTQAELLSRKQKIKQ